MENYLLVIAIPHLVKREKPMKRFALHRDCSRLVLPFMQSICQTGLITFGDAFFSQYKIDGYCR